MVVVAVGVRGDVSELPVALQEHEDGPRERRPVAALRVLTNDR